MPTLSLDDLEAAKVYSVNCDRFYAICHPAVEAEIDDAWATAAANVFGSDLADVARCLFRRHEAALAIFDDGCFAAGHAYRAAQGVPLDVRNTAHHAAATTAERYAARAVYNAALDELRAVRDLAVARAFVVAYAVYCKEAAHGNVIG